MRSLSKAIFIFLFCVSSSFLAAQISQILGTSPAPSTTTTPTDPLGRNTPSGSVLGFLKAAQSGDYTLATQFLQLSAARRQTDCAPASA